MHTSDTEHAAPALQALDDHEAAATIGGGFYGDLFNALGYLADRYVVQPLQDLGQRILES